MERLTVKNNERRSLQTGYKYLGGEGATSKKILNKLGEYEDLEEQGRLIVLPCKVGETVYSLRRTFECDYDYDCQEYDAYKCEEGVHCEHEYKVYKVAETKFQIQMLATLGKAIFLTKEEAEKALAEMG